MSSYKDSIKKPNKPHRQIEPDEIISREEIEKRIIREQRLEALGINVAVIDDSKESEDMDELTAFILIMQDKEIPKDLEEKLKKKMCFK